MSEAFKIERPRCLDSVRVRNHIPLRGSDEGPSEFDELHAYALHMESEAGIFAGEAARQLQGWLEERARLTALQEAVAYITKGECLALTAHRKLKEALKQSKEKP